MAEPRSDWGAEVKRKVALLEEKFESQTDKLGEVATDVKQLVSDNASSKTSIRILLAIVAVLFGGSILAQLWAGKQTGDKLDEISANSAKIDTLLSNDTESSGKFERLADANSKQDTDLAAVGEQLRHVQTTVTSVQTTVSRLETDLQTASSDLKAATDAAKQAAKESQLAAQDTLKLLDQGIAEAKLDVFSIRAELSLRTFDKAAGARGVDPDASYFTVELGAPVLPADVRRAVVTLLTPQFDINEMGLGQVALKCSVTANSKAVIMAWSTSGRRVDEALTDEKKLDVELVITSLVDNVSSRKTPD